jgi:hypothetical protein
VVDEYERRKAELVVDLAEARSKISISFDGWTSPAQRGYVAICAHFIDSQGNRRIALLAVRRLKGRHSGENYASVLAKVFEEYGLTADNIG